MTTAPGAATRIAPHADLRIDPMRLLRRLDDLGRIGMTPQGGVTRPAFSAEDREAVRYLAAEATGAGLRADVDPAGNLLVRRAHPAGSRRGVVMMGSHLDTVINAGRLDGAYGVVAALEVVQVLAEARVQTRLDPVAVGFANEEGTLFPQPFWGSMAIAGQADRLPAEPTDRHGNPLREALREIGGRLDAVPLAAWPPGSIDAYLELHIEQGPVLEDLDVPIGVVTAIVGRLAFDVRVRGRSGHAGTMPMAGRQDAAVAASHVVLAAERIAATQRMCRVATAGRLEIGPDATNVVPGSAFVTVEFRDESAARLADVERAFHAELTAIADRTGCEVRARETVRTVPVPTDPALRALIARCATELGHAHASLTSGAGHDAQIIASIAPIGMIFVPSRDGVSHVPEEYTAPEQLVAGADVLLRAALSL